MPAEIQTNAQQIDSLTTIDAVTKALKETTQLAQETENELEQQLKTASKLSSNRALTLSTSSQLAAAISDDAEELTSLLSSATRISDSACIRLRQLDVLLTRAKDTLEWADDILTLRVCTEGAKTSLSADDLNSAAKHVQQYLQLSTVVREDQANAAAVSQIQQSITELQRKVRERSTAKLDRDRNMSPEQVVDAVRLFVPIGLRQEGLEKMTENLKRRIAVESDNDVRSLLIDNTPDDQNGMDEPHIVALARLFESIAGYLHDCQPHIESLFNSSSIPFFIGELQKQCDICAKRILSRYQESKRIEEIMRSLRSDTANARDLDALLNEMTLLSQRIAGYFQFLDSREIHQLDNDPKAENNSAELKAQVSKVLSDCELTKYSEDFAGYYNAMEAYFMRENARLAISIDESNVEGAETSTAVDDFFFVMQKCFQRAFAFADTKRDVLRLVLQQISMGLTSDLLTYLQRRLRQTEAALENMLGDSLSPATSTGGLSVSYLTELAKANIAIPLGNEEDSQNNDPAKYDYIIALNNTAVSAEYATRLRANVEKAIQVSPKLSPDDRSLLSAPISQITESARSLTLAAEHGVSRLSAVLLGRITTSIDDALKRAMYVVTEAEYSLNSEATPAFSREIANELESKVLSSSLEKRLTENNWDGLVRLVAEWYASKVETTIFLPPPTSMYMPKKFNAYGCLRADRDVRAISSYFSEKSRRSTVRDVFGRLSQLAMVVNLERPAEIYDIWGPNAGGMTWRLSASEVRRTLLLRSDFNQEAVRSLKL